MTPHSSEELSLKASVLGTSTGTLGTEINHGPCSKVHLQIGEKDLGKDGRALPCGQRSDGDSGMPDLTQRGGGQEPVWKRQNKHQNSRPAVRKVWFPDLRQSASSGNLLKMQILGAHPRPTESAVCVLTSP